MLKARVVANQLERLGGHSWSGAAQPLSDAGPTGWRTRVRLDVGADRRPGFHRYHSDELVTDLRCGQLPDGMLDGLARAAIGRRTRRCMWSSTTTGSGTWCARCGRASALRGLSRRWPKATITPLQRVGGRSWRVPVTAFWQSHRDAARVYSGLVADWAQAGPGMTAWDLYGGAGLFASVLADAVGESGRVLTVDTSRGASGAARAALADLPQVEVRTDSVRRGVAAQDTRADVAVLDPPRSGAGRDVIDLLAAAEVPRVVHIGCEAASFARDIGLYRGHGYAVEQTQGVRCVPVDPSRRVRRIADSVVVASASLPNTPERLLARS